MKLLTPFKIRFLTLAALGAVLLIGPAAGENPSALAGHFGLHRNSCYARDYDEAHLKAHPNQRIARIRIEHFPGLYGPYGEDGKVHMDETTGEVHFTVTVAYRDKPYALLSDSGTCTPDGDKLNCYIECDGGGFSLTDAGADAILLHNRGFRVMACGEDETEGGWVNPEPDDKVFKLTRVPDSECVPPPEELETNQ